MTEVVRRQLVLAGRVVDGRTGEPVAGALVVLATVPAALKRKLAVGSAAFGPAWDEHARPPDRARTDAGGRFSFLDLPSGAYALKASLPGSGSRYGTVRARARVSRDRKGNAAVELVDLSLPSTTVTGTVTGADGKPVVLASVEAKGSPERTFTDGRGKYVLSGLETGERTLLVRARGYEAAEKAAALAKPGAAKTVDVTLTGAVS